MKEKLCYVASNPAREEASETEKVAPKPVWLQFHEKLTFFAG